MHRAFWVPALDRNPRGANIILKIGDRRSKLLGLDHSDDDLAARQRTGR